MPRPIPPSSPPDAPVLMTPRGEAAFAEPPPDAPREVSQPLSPSLIADQLAKARAHERTLAPLLAQGPKRPDPAAGTGLVGPDGQPIAATPPALPPDAPPLAWIGHDLRGAAPVMQEVIANVLAEEIVAAEDLSHAPAASNTDSPARGIPSGPQLRPGREPLVVTGGFGESGQGDYFALDGEELKEVVRSLLDKINESLEGDLRFSMAVCYPEVRVSIKVEVVGHPSDTSFVIEKGVHHGDAGTFAAAEVILGQTLPEEAFTIAATHDEQEVPPDQAREQLGLEVPMKQRRTTGIGQIVDRKR